MKRANLALTIGLIVIAGSGCAGAKGLLAMNGERRVQPPIHNPFDSYTIQNSKPENIVLRTKKGDRAVEVELPGSTSDMTEFVLPVSPAFRDSSGGRSPASSGDASIVDESYRERQPSISDREIANTMPQGTKDTEGARREIEAGLGLAPSEDTAPNSDRSYLASLDHVKQLYKTARYEAALLEIDEMLRAYPTDPKLYEMRGTLFDRTGRSDLALKSWNQAVRLDPSNQSLRKFVDRKQQKRSLASP